MSEKSSNKFVKDILSKGGLMFSEHDGFTTDFDSYTKRLLARDRLVTGASDIVIVVEGIERSGTIDTAKKGIIQGKKVVVIDWDRIVDHKKDIKEYE